MSFVEQQVLLPNCDADVVIVFPTGERLVVQVRPSNADVHSDRVYPGSLDIIFPETTYIGVFKDDALTPAPRYRRNGNVPPHERLGKHIVSELPSPYPEDTGGDGELHISSIGPSLDSTL